MANSLFIKVDWLICIKLQFYFFTVSSKVFIFNADPNQFFLESLSLNNKKITDLANATSDDNAVNLSQLRVCP